MGCCSNMELLLASMTWQCMSLNYLQTRHCQSPTPPPGKKAVRISKVLHCHVLNVDVAETEALTKISIPLKFEIQIFMRSLTIIVTSTVCHWHCRWQSGNLNRTRTKYQSHCQCHCQRDINNVIVIVNVIDNVKLWHWHCQGGLSILD